MATIDKLFKVRVLKKMVLLLHDSQSFIAKVSHPLLRFPLRIITHLAKSMCSKTVSKYSCIETLVDLRRKTTLPKVEYKILN